MIYPLCDKRRDRPFVRHSPGIVRSVELAYELPGKMLNKLFTHPKPVIGMIHVGALPGTPANTQTMAEIVAQAVYEAAIYHVCGIDGIIIENMHDVPYLCG